MSLADRLQKLRERWEQRLRARDPEARQTVRALLRALLYKRRDDIEEAVESLWDENQTTWVGMYTAHYDRTHRRMIRRGTSYTEAHQVAHARAVSRVRQSFFQALRKAWVEREDDRIRWMWAGGFQDLLEELDGKGLELLLEGVLAVINAVASRTPLLTTAQRVVEDLADDRIEALLDAAIVGEPDDEPATPARQREPARPVQAQPLPGAAPRRDAVVDLGGGTVLPLEEIAAADDAGELDEPTDDDDEDDGDTVVAPAPVVEEPPPEDVPSRAPFPEVRPVSALRRAVERTLHKGTLAGKTTDRVKGLVKGDRDAAGRTESAPVVRLDIGAVTLKPPGEA